MKVKQKKCKVCKTSFTPQRTTQQVCSYACAIELGKQKEIKKQERQDRINQEFQSNKASLIIEQKIKDVKKQTKKIVHAYVRDRDRGKKCATCNAVLVDGYDAGHCYKAELYETLIFDLDNIFGQCVQCNRRYEGRPHEYITNLPNIIGAKRAEALAQKAREDKKQQKVWDIPKLKKIQEEVKKLHKNL